MWFWSRHLLYFATRFMTASPPSPQMLCCYSCLNLLWNGFSRENLTILISQRIFLLLVWLVVYHNRVQVNVMHVHTYSRVKLFLLCLWRASLKLWLWWLILLQFHAHKHTPVLIAPICFLFVCFQDMSKVHTICRKNCDKMCSEVPRIMN